MYLQISSATLIFDIVTTFSYAFATTIIISIVTILIFVSATSAPQASSPQPTLSLPHKNQIFRHRQYLHRIQYCRYINTALISIRHYSRRHCHLHPKNDNHPHPIDISVMSISSFSPLPSYLSGFLRYHHHHHHQHNPDSHTRHSSPSQSASPKPLQQSAF